MSFQLLDGRFRGEDDSGLPLVGGLLYTYVSGTTTPKATYTDSTLATPNLNPVQLNARGEAQIWLSTGTYTFILKTSLGVTIWSVDGVTQNNAGLVDVTTFGADPSGSGDSLSALARAFAASSAIFVSAVTSSYHLSANWQPPAQDTVIQMAGNVVFSGGKVDFNNLIPYEAAPGPLLSLNLMRKIYGASFAGQGNIFQWASYAQANVATVPVVAIYGQGEAKAPNSRAWGMNPAGVASNATAVAITIEVDPVCTVAGATAYAVVVASSASVPGGIFPNGFQMDANSFNARFQDGLLFHFSETIVAGDTNPRGLLSNACISITGGSGTGSVCQNFIKAAGVTTTAATIDLPGLLVDACNVSTVANRLRITNGATGVGPGIRPAGTDPNADCNVGSKGTGAVQVLDGSSNVRFAANSTGVAFNGNAAIAKPTAAVAATDAASTQALANSLRTILINYGLAA